MEYRSSIILCQGGRTESMPLKAVYVYLLCVLMLDFLSNTIVFYFYKSIYCMAL